MKRDLENLERYAMDDEVLEKVTGGTGDDELNQEAMEAYNRVNEERNVAGLEPLKWDQNLEQVKQTRANDCSNAFSHTRPNGQAWYTVNSQIQGGENLAFGVESGSDAVEAWMNSPTHRDNVQYDEFNKVAIGIYEDDDGTGYWSQQFGY